MRPVTLTLFLPGRCLHAEYAHRRIFFPLVVNNCALYNSARDHSTLVNKHPRTQQTSSDVQIQALPSSVIKVGTIFSTLRPSAYVFEAKYNTGSSLKKCCSRNFSNTTLFNSSVPGISSTSTSPSSPPSTSINSNTNPQSTNASSSNSGSSSSAFVEKRVHAEKASTSGSPVKTGSTSSATTPAAAKRLTGLHKICDLKGPLASFMGKSEASRIEVIKHVWDHIKRHNLQSAENKKMINADHALKPILQKDQVSMFEMNKLLSKYVQSRPVTSSGVSKD